MGREQLVRVAMNIQTKDATGSKSAKMSMKDGAKGGVGVLDRRNPKGFVTGAMTTAVSGDIIMRPRSEGDDRLTESHRNQREMTTRSRRKKVHTTFDLATRWMTR